MIFLLISQVMAATCDSMEACTQACQAGKADACTTLGDSLVKGQLLEAVHWWEQGCALGDGRACANRGVVLMQQHDAVGAATWFEKACTLSSGNGCYMLGSLYLEGQGMPKDMAKVTALYDRACSLSWAKACTSLAMIQGIPTGLTYFEKACTYGDSWSCYHLGNAYQTATNVPLDLAHAAQLYTQACDRGMVEACVPLAGILSDDTYTKQDVTRAEVLYKRACDRKIAAGCEGLSWVLHTRGELPGALAALEQGCQLGSAAACAEAGQLHLSAKDWGGAVILLDQACSGKVAESCEALGLLYKKGMGVERDKLKAETLHTQACELGYSDCSP